MTDSRWLNELSKTYVGKLNEAEEHDLSDPSLIYHSERRDGVTPDAATLRLRAREKAAHNASLKNTEPKKLGIGTDGKKMTRAATEIEESRVRYEQTQYISDLEELVEQQLQEHAEYISTLETMLALVVEEFDIDVDSLVEAAKKPMPKKPMPKKAMPKQSLSPAQLKALGMTRSGERAAARGTGGSGSTVAARTAALNRLEKVASTAQGRSMLKKLG
jgi:hypothetical protein